MKLALGLLALLSSAALAQTVRFQTNLGDIDVTLLPESAPATVENFLRYVNRGAFNRSIFHRSVPGFIIQGGGYTSDIPPREIPSDPPVRNEFRISNTRGMLAMAKLGNNPNSATNQWFFNLANNASNLNTQNGGFTVFGRVADAAGLAVMDRIAAVPVFNAGAPFDGLPLQNYRTGNIAAANLIVVNAIALVEPTPAISENGVISAGAYGALKPAAAGSYIEIYGSNLAGGPKEWAAADFVDGRAPTSLDEVTVTVDGKPAFVRSISPSQVNAQVPADVAVGGTVPVVVQYRGRQSAAVALAIRERAGGLLAPASFNLNGKQYVAAFHHAGGALVAGAGIPDVAVAPAIPGETLVFYGIGFGQVTPGPVAGQIAKGASELTTQVQFQFGDTQAEVLYAGLAPEFVGLYQFNVIAPAGLASGDVPLKVLVGGEAIAQTLFVPVR